MKTIVVELDPADYDRLRDEAARQGKALDALARDYLRAQLPDQTDADDKRRQVLEALEKFRELREQLRREGYPSLDGVELARQSREELERRSLY